jgi:hypothetical protein
MNETPQEKERRMFEHYKHLLERGLKQVRFNVIEYLCRFPKIDPYKMAVAIKRDGLAILFDDTSITLKENLQKERKFMKMYLKENKR